MELHQAQGSSLIMEFDYQALIRLKSLDDSSEQIISINPKTQPTFDIGRASKTKMPPPCIQFNSPVMSRIHAEISLEGGYGQSLLIMDRSSTHGTFIGEKRLPPCSHVAMDSGTIVTFGQKVISNTVEHHAKHVCITYEWQRLESIPATLPERRRGSGFRVPDSSPESSDSEGSGASSMKKSRKSPLTDDVSAAMRPCQLRSVLDQSQTAVQEIIDLTDPESSLPASEDERLNVGLTEANPIDLVEAGIPTESSESPGLDKHQRRKTALFRWSDYMKNHCFYDDDDGMPDILPIPRTLRGRKDRKVENPADTDSKRVSGRPSDQFALARGLDHEPSSSINTPELYVADIGSPMAGGIFSGASSELETDVSSRRSSTFDEYLKEVISRDVSIPSTSAQHFNGMESDVSTGDPRTMHSDDEYDDGDGLLYEDDERSSPFLHLGATLHKPYVLPLKPTDTTGTAALEISLFRSRDLTFSDLLESKESTMGAVEHRSKEIGDMDAYQRGAICSTMAPEIDHPRRSIHRAPSPSDAALAKPAKVTATRDEQVSATHAAKLTRPSSLRPPSPVREDADQALRIEDGKANDCCSSMIRPEPRQIYQTPRQLSSGNILQEVDALVDFPSYPEGAPTRRDVLGYPSFTADVQRQQELWRRHDATFRGRTTTREEEQLQSTSTRWTNTMQLVAPDQLSLKSPSRAPISDIVNKSNDLGQATIRKRKLCEMQAADEEDMLISNDDWNTHPIHDAQLRDDLSKIGPEKSPLTTISEEANVTTTATVMSSELSARKRVKTIDTGRPFKAFLSGVAFGCITLAGACAAFVATIPECVTEEALRQLH